MACKPKEDHDAQEATYTRRDRGQVTPGGRAGRARNGAVAKFWRLRLVEPAGVSAPPNRRWPVILNALVEKLKRRSKDDFKGRHFEATLILQAVSWYLRYPLSYRDIEELF